MTEPESPALKDARAFDQFMKIGLVIIRWQKHMVIGVYLMSALCSVALIERFHTSDAHWKEAQASRARTEMNLAAANAHLDLIEQKLDDCTCRVKGHP